MQAMICNYHQLYSFIDERVRMCYGEGEVMDMPDYKTMYHILCAAASAALDELPDGPENAAGRDILQNALNEAEDIYIETADEEETASL